MHFSLAFSRIYSYSNKRCRRAELITGETLIRGRRLFLYRYLKARRLLEGGAYLRPGTYYRKYGTLCIIYLHIIEACLKVAIAMSHFDHSKSSSNTMKNILDYRIPF